MEMSQPQSEPPFRAIGKGNCGSVWAIKLPGEDTSALKRGDGATTRSVRKDSDMHQRIERALHAVQLNDSTICTQLSIPEHRALILGTDMAFWMGVDGRFPAGFQPCDTLATEHILPFERSARENLIDRFFLPRIKDRIKRNPEDEDCLVRPYLGRLTHSHSPFPLFTLRNKPLHVDQMREIGLPVEEYARTMADALAVMY
jgi:hypothetical protein